MKNFIYKICSSSEWNNAQKNGVFNGSKKDILDGYIHFSNKNQVKSTLNRYFLNKNKLVLIKVDTSKLKKLFWEKSSGGLTFPHLYSFLSINHVVGTYKITSGDDGKHVLPSNF